MNNLELTSNLSFEEAKIIADGIASESTHMITKTPEKILEEFNECGGVVARISGKIAGIIKLSVLDSDKQIYERGSLFVLPQYRQHWIGRTLIHKINEQFRDLSLLSVTNVPTVKHINNSDENQVFVPREALGSLLAIIEWPQALLEDDSVFLNKTLYDRVQTWEF